MSEYLERNLLPLVLGINVIKTESLPMIAAGLGHKTSHNSILIQLGNRLEDFWNAVISKCAINLIETNNKIEINGKNRQLDHLFKDLDENLVYYLDSKCNLNFDTEKKPASNAKLEAICNTLKTLYEEEVITGYFIPCIRDGDIPNDIKKKYPNFNIVGVDWLMNKIHCNLFTVDEFFTFFENVLGPILEEKMYD